MLLLKMDLSIKKKSPYDIDSLLGSDSGRKAETTSEDGESNDVIERKSGK